MTELNKLIQRAEEIAEGETGGHVSMFKFTTGWKVFLGTLNLDIGEEHDYISDLQTFATLEDALKDLVINKTNRWK